MGNFSKVADEDFQNQPVMPAIPPARVVTLWDIGPQLPSPAPTQPESTATPAQWSDYELAVADYVKSIYRFQRERWEWQQKSDGGAMEIVADPTSANEISERGDARRYLKKLPTGIKAGPHRIRIGGV